MKKIMLLITAALLLTLSVDAIEKDKLIAFFKSHDASIEKKNWGCARLPYAIEKGYIEVAEFLIRNGEPIEDYRELVPVLLPGYEKVMDTHFKHPLLTSIRKGYADLAILMISILKNVSNIHEYKILYRRNISNNILTVERKNAMHIAITECPNSNLIVPALIKVGADVNKSCSYHVYDPNSPIIWFTESFTPLKAAIEHKKLDIVHILLCYNADIESKGDGYLSPLLKAVDDDYTDCVRMLIARGANPLIRHGHLEHGYISPLELAMKKENWEIFDLLYYTTLH